jgi:hypothetical protein
MARQGGVLPALNRNVERVFTNRKDSQGKAEAGKRSLTRGLN